MLWREVGRGRLCFDCVVKELMQRNQHTGGKGKKRLTVRREHSISSQLGTIFGRIDGLNWAKKLIPPRKLASAVFFFTFNHRGDDDNDTFDRSLQHGNEQGAIRYLNF